MHKKKVYHGDVGAALGAFVVNAFLTAGIILVWVYLHSLTNALPTLTPANWAVVSTLAAAAGFACAQTLVSFVELCSTLNPPSGGE